MKIAVFHNLHSGGAKRALYNYVNFLSNDNEIDAFVPSTANENYLPLKDIVDNIKVFPVKNSITNRILSAIKYFPYKISLLELEKTQKHMAETVNNGDYDVVLCEQDVYTMAPFFLKYIKKPHVYYCQQPIIFRNEIIRKLYINAGMKKESKIRNSLAEYYWNLQINHDKKYANYAKYVVVNSYFSREVIMRSYGINSFVSYLGVDTSLFKPLGLPKENFVLSVGQYIPEKGFDFIINSLSKIDMEMRPELIIVSDQGIMAWKNHLQDLATKLNVKLRILTMIDDEELVSLYNKAKLVVYAPYLEPFGLVPLEAMSCGTPVVAVKEGGLKESVIHGETGILTDRNEEMFAKAIVELISNEEERKKFADKSIKAVNKFWTLNDSGKRLFTHLKHSLDIYEE
jgi:glycosyltransferase involved in cell wall biosynthesis